MSKAGILSVFLVIILSIIYANPSTKKLNEREEEDVAELLVKNGVIYTSDPSLPFADSMAIKHGRILAIGNFSSLQVVFIIFALKGLEGSTTEVLDLEGRVVVPGFIDSHVHLLPAGIQMSQVEFHGVNTKWEFVEKIEDAVKRVEEETWILGGGWNNDLWGGEMPSASWIDDVTPHNPVWLSRLDGHIGLANSLALKLAGITRDTIDPVGGTIVRTTDGEPTGLLVDAAMQLMVPFVPKPSVSERREALLRASKYALTKGVTTVVDMGRYLPGSSIEVSWQDFKDVYSWASSFEKMRIRVCLFFPIQTWSGVSDLVQKTGHVVSQWLYLGGVKAFVDGSLGSSSALFYEPYLDTPESSGLQVMDLSQLYNLTALSYKSGLQVAIHAIGDRANDLILDMYKSVVSANGIRDRRFRIEHAQHLAPGSAIRFGEQGIVASPLHLLDEADFAAVKLGKERAEKGSYLFNTLQSSLSVLAFGSDWPVAGIDPMNNIRAAVKRTPLGWRTSWIPSECLRFNDALDSHTILAARASFLDKHVGSLCPGKLADFVVLSTNSWENLASEAYAPVEATYVGGVIAYSIDDVVSETRSQI